MARENEWICRAAFNITAAFEGRGYASFQNFDDGIVSYGRFQFALAAGSLFTVLDRYLASAQSPVANALREQYLARAFARDAALRADEEFKRLLLEAAADPAMQAAQDSVAKERYWDLVQRLSVQPRNLQTPLAQALLFDMAINHGPRHDMIGLAEEALGVPPRSRIPDNGITEAALVARVAAIRQERLGRLAEKHAWGGLRQRGDFWVALVESGDWELLGNAQGCIEVKPGVRVLVRFPEEVPPKMPGDVAEAPPLAG